jgi:tetratricopeptide (TPR) repeat protein
MRPGGTSKSDEQAQDEVYPADPLRLLESVPELELFLSDRRVRGGIERARPHDVYRALFWARLFGRFRAHREVLSRLLSDRRLFVGPMRGAPGMFTYNGVGLSVYGDSERKQDGAYIGTHFIVFFFVPIFPLASYLMCQAGGNSYRFFGSAPFGVATWLWNRLMVLGVVGAVLFGLGTSIVSSRFADVEVVNGLPFPVTASVCGRETELEPQSHLTVTVSVGPCQLSARDPLGNVVDGLPVTLRAGRDLTAWNIAGAAPLYRETVVYGPGTPRAPDLYCGQSFVELDDVDFVFRDPPSSVSTSRAGSARRTHVAIADLGELFCMIELVSNAEREAGIRMGRAIVAGAGFEPVATTMTARNLAAMDAPDAALELLRQSRSRYPDDLALHLEYQAVMVGLGRRMETLEEYRTLAATRSEGWAQYLAERLDASPGSVLRWRALAGRFPEEPRVVHALAVTECEAGNFVEGLAAFARAAAQDPDDALGRVALRAECLAAAGRTEEALSLVEEAFGVGNGFDRASLASLHRDLSALLVPPRPSALFERLSVDQRAGWTEVYRGLSRDEIPASDVEALERPLPYGVVRILVAARTSPGRAFEGASGLASGARSFLPTQLYAMLLGEAARLEAGATESLASGMPYGPDVGAAMVEYVRTGVEGDLVRSLPRSVRAGLAFSRSRVLTATPDERAAALALAHELDAIPSWIPVAEQGWPLP